MLKLIKAVKLLIKIKEQIIIDWVNDNNIVRQRNGPKYPA